MNWHTSLRSLLVLALTAPVVLPIGIAAQAQSIELKHPLPFLVSLDFNPPKRNAPRSTVGGATRGRCLRTKLAPTALIPKGGLGLTLAARPSLFVYVPKSPARTANVLLLGENDTRVLYETRLTLPDQAGILRFDLPADAPALAVGQQYHWYVTLLCDPTKGPSGNPTVDGWVERVPVTAELNQALQTSRATAHPELYAKFGLWHETLQSLDDLRQQAPNRPAVRADWRELLTDVGLGAIAGEPRLDCCTTQRSRP